MENIVVLTGAGISAESGLSTFRDSGGLWEEYNVYEVATPEAWEKDQKLVLDFYNQRRKQVLEAEPNAAHYALASLEEKFNVTIITQNVDDLHERAGSTNIIHLHGEITKAQSSVDPSLVYDIEDWELKSGKKCEKGSQLRPYIVWFGEAVPKMTDASIITESAAKLIIIGTSLNVYPAAGLIDIAGKQIDKYLIDPNEMNVGGVKNLTIIKEKASTGVPKLAEELLANS
ncbi:MAG TPA: NAD-dependent deacylase [Flavobacteriales bacterium]|nr:NAD-dependent deacylase [Flavobacteriales bacterium]HIA12538.1 NAD-dependent deacylase [Flavobacteriales bacterium]HIO73019.1 NAD-dependent deacylase [Flavobacteriales bacterium]